MKNFSARESLPGEKIIEIIIGKSVDELEGYRLGHTMYPDMSSEDIKKAFPAYETLATGMLNRFHEEPIRSTETFKETRAKLKDAVPLHKFCSWFLEEKFSGSMKKISGFVVNPKVKKNFINLVLGQSLVKTKKSDPHPNTNKACLKRLHEDYIAVATEMLKKNPSLKWPTFRDTPRLKILIRKTGLSLKKSTLQRKWIPEARKIAKVIGNPGAPNKK